MRRMTTLLLAVAAAATVEASGTAGEALDAACPRPAWSAEVPGTPGASREQMAEAGRALRDFDAAVTAYGECLQVESDRLAADAAMTDAGRTALLDAVADRNDAAVGEVERLAAAFNAQLRAWRAAQEAGARFNPPRLKSPLTSRHRDRCFPSDVLGYRNEMQLLLTLEIDPDGAARVVDYPPGLSPEMKEASVCAIRTLRFEPATRDGMAVAAKVRLPITFNQGDKPVDRTMPDVESSATELAALRQSCQPAGLASGGDVLVEITVNREGAVTRTRVLRSAGEPAVDAAAECILRGTRFSPSTRNGTEVESTVQWTVTVAP